jgi:hypothetical protein
MAAQPRLVFVGDKHGSEGEERRGYSSMTAVTSLIDISPDQRI